MFHCVILWFGARRLDRNPPPACLSYYLTNLLKTGDSDELFERNKLLYPDLADLIASAALIY